MEKVEGFSEQGIKIRYKGYEVYQEDSTIFYQALLRFKQALISR